MSTNRWMDKEHMYIYAMLFYSLEKTSRPVRGRKTAERWKGQMWARYMTDLDVCVDSVHTALIIILYSIFYCVCIYFGTAHEVKCGNTYDIISAPEVSNSWSFCARDTQSAYIINLFHTYKNKGNIIITNSHLRLLRHVQNIRKSAGFWIRDPF